MPLLDSFKVDHTRMNAPAVRVAKTMRTPKGDDITVFDLRFCIPNKEILPPKGIHTLEHLFAGFMRGFYMSLIGTPNEQQVADAWLASMKDILTVQDQNQIPELNEYQCGTYTEHSLEEAHDIAKNVIARGVGINKNDDLALDESFLK
mgnify:CR=1 FL=1